MRIMKKVIGLGLAAVMTVSSLTGCGSDNAEEKSAGTNETQEEQNADTKEDENASEGKKEDTTDSAGEKGSAAAEKFVIGGLGPLTGSSASYGNSVKNGAQIAVDEINAAGGVKVGDTTYTLELNFADDEATEEKAVTAYNSLMDSGIHALVGAVTTGACLAVIDQTYADGILQITPSGSGLECTRNPNAFRLCFTDPFQGKTMADYAVETLGFKNIAVLYNNADEYSTGIKEAFEEEVKAKGGNIVASEAFVTDDVDFKAQLTSIKSTDAEVIFIPAYYDAVSYITKQAKDLGMELPFLGSDGWDGILDAVTDPDVVEGAVFLSPFLATDTNESVVSFVETYKNDYNATPDQFAADGYDSVYVIKAAMEQAKSVENEALIAAMTEIEVDGLTGKVSFTADGEPDKGAKFVEIVNGEYTVKE